MPPRRGHSYALGGVVYLGWVAGDATPPLPSLADWFWLAMCPWVLAGLVGLVRARGLGSQRASHERWDGAGYPDGLAGEEIPLGARIIAVCDAFRRDGHRSPLPRRMPRVVAEAELQRCAGSQFDPAVVAASLVSVDDVAPTARPAAAARV